MGPKNISLANAFRYLFGSVVAWTYWAILDYRMAKRPIQAIVELTGGGGVTSVAVLTSLTLVTGSIIYFLFRSLIFDIAVMRLVDGYCGLWKRQTYRTWVIGVLKKYDFKISTSKAQHIAKIIDNKKLGKDFYTDKILRAYSGTFLLYLAGILGVIISGLFLWHLEPSRSDQALYYLEPWQVFVFGIICSIAGLVLDARQSEHGALALMERTSDREVLDVAMKIGLIDRRSEIDWPGEPSPSGDALR